MYADRTKNHLFYSTNGMQFTCTYYIVSGIVLGSGNIKDYTAWFSRQHSYTIHTYVCANVCVCVCRIRPCLVWHIDRLKIVCIIIQYFRLSLCFMYIRYGRARKPSRIHRQCHHTNTCGIDFLSYIHCAWHTYTRALQSTRSENFRSKQMPFRSSERAQPHRGDFSDFSFFANRPCVFDLCVTEILLFLSFDSTHFCLSSFSIIPNAFGSEFS